MGSTVLALLVAAVNLTSVGDYLDVEALRALVDGTGLYAPLAFFGLTAASIFVGAPRLIFCVVGGALFGFVEGLVLSQMATILGSSSSRGKKIVANIINNLKHKIDSLAKQNRVALCKRARQ